MIVCRIKPYSEHSEIEWEPLTWPGITVLPDGWVNLAKCPETNGFTFYWWCGKRAATPCHTGRDASTFPLRGGQFQTIIAKPEAASSTRLTTTSTSSTSINSASATNAPVSLVGSAPVSITATATLAAENNSGSGGSGGNDKTPIAIGAGVGIPLGITALGFLGFFLWREQNLRKQRRDDRVVPSMTQQEYWPRGVATTMQPRSPMPPHGELMGDMAERELLVAPAPVHEL